VVRPRQKNDSSGRPFAKYRKLFRVVEQRPDANFKIHRGRAGRAPAVEVGKSAAAALPIPRGRAVLPAEVPRALGPMEAGKFEYRFRRQRPTDTRRTAYATSPEGMATLVNAAGRVEPLRQPPHYVLFMDDKQSAESHRALVRHGRARDDKVVCRANE